MNLGRRLRRLLCAPEGGPTVLAQRLHDHAITVRYWVTGSRLESSLLLYKLARVQFPEDCMARLRLRLPWFVALVDFQRFARLIVTNRLVKGAESMIGPFRNRETAQRYEEELLAGFSLRRCSEDLIPAPDHPGCVYGEIKLCSRPCQGAISNSEYRREAADVKDFLLTNGANALRSLSLAREKAAAETEFETAASIHKRIEKLKAVARNRDTMVADLENFNGIAVTEGPGINHWRLWPMLSGFWQEPITFQKADGALNMALWEGRLRELLAPVSADPSRDGHQAEHLAIFTRWYYSSWRDGDWVAWPDLNKAPSRKLARHLAKRAKESAEPAAALSC